MHAYNPPSKFSAQSIAMRAFIAPRCEVDGTMFTVELSPQIGGLIRLTVRAQRGMLALDYYAGTVERTLPVSTNDAAIAIEANDMVQQLLPSTLEARKQIALAMV